MRDLANTTRVWTPTNTEFGQLRQPRGTRDLEGHSQPVLSLIVKALVLIGFVASIIAVDVSNPKTFTSTGVLTTVKTTNYYIAHIIQISTLLSAGCVSWLLIGRQQRRVLILPVAAFFATATIMTVRGYTMEELLSAKVVGATGIVPCLLSVLIFFGIHRQHWKLIDRLIDWTAFSLVGLIVLASARHPFHTRGDALANLQGYLTALYIPSAWVILKPTSGRRLASNLLHFLPITAYAAGSLLTQTRLNLVLLVPLFGMYVFVQLRRNRVASATGTIAIVLLAALLAAPLVISSRVGESLAWSWQGLLNRLGDDTRTGQIAAYFADLSPTELLFGRGSQAAYLWAGKLWIGGIDVGYLMLMLYGGVPLMVTYVVLHIVPGIKALRHPISSRQLTCAACVTLWGIRLLSTGYMDYNPGYYCLLFCVAGCFPQPPNSGRPFVMPSRVARASATRVVSVE